jgi:hypothetical protein
MNSSEWCKNDTSYYAVYYTDCYGDRCLEVVTNDFGGWLKETNKDRVDEDHPNADDVGIKYDADDFWLEDVEMFFRKGRV